MNVKELLYKYKSLIIIILLFLVVFTVRAEAANIGGVPDEAKSFYQDSAGLPYFSEMDSYYHIRLTSDLLDHGYLGDTKVDGSQWDLHSSYPPGKSANYPPLIAYLAGIGFVIANLFGKVPLVVVCFWMGAFIASLAVIPAYFLVKKITNVYGGIVAGLLVGLAPAYVGHTHAGFFDTDMFGMVIPLLIVLFFVLSLNAENFRKRTVYASLAAFSMLLFALAWQGWWYIYYLIIASAVIYLIATHYIFPLKPRKSTDMLKGRLAWFNNKPDLFTFALFMVLSIILMSIFLGVIGFLLALTEPINVNQLQSAVQTTSYPNVYLTVGELRQTDMNDVIGGVGGFLPFLFGFLGIMALWWKLRPKKEKKIVEEKTRKPRRRGRSNRRREENKEYKADKVIIKPDIGYQKSNYIFYVILFSIWLLITIYAMTKGVRFIENFALPITLTAGIFVGLLYDYVKDRIPNTSYQKIVMAIIIVVVAFSPLTTAYTQTSYTVPGTNDAMINSLEWVKNNTSNNTVITSWWDFGHLFTFVADRPVTFDGSSQNTPRAYWVGRALSTNNESLSVGIIRMLASTGDTATYLLANYTKSSGKSADILDNILGVDKETAVTLMTTKYGLTTEQAQNVLQYTHPDNPATDIFITSHDMIEKAGAWAMLGNWNFTTNGPKKYLSFRAELSGMKVNNKTLFAGINRGTGLGVVAQANGTSMSVGIFDLSKMINQDQNKILDQMSTELTTGNGSMVVPPNKLTIVNNGNVTQTTVSNSSTFSIILFQQNNGYESFVISKELDDSIFIRLFVFGGEGLTHFKQLYGQPGVVVWSVNY